MIKRNAVIVSTLVFWTSAVAGVIGISLFRKNYIQGERTKTNSLLISYEDSISGLLDSRMNYALDIKNILLSEGEQGTYLDYHIKQVLDYEGVEYVCITDDTKITSFYTNGTDDFTGTLLTELDYAYQLAKLQKISVKEGPASDALSAHEDVFLFVEPIITDGTVVGMVSTAIDLSVVFQAFKLPDLKQSGYEYCFWRTNPTNGDKEILVQSNDKISYAQARVVQFSLPTTYVLSIIPEGGWGHSYSVGIKYALVTMLSFSFAVTTYFLIRYYTLQAYQKSVDRLDTQMNIPNRLGLTTHITTLMRNGKRDLTLLYICVPDVKSALLLADADEIDDYLENLKNIVEAYIKHDALLTRVNDNSFAILFEQHMNNNELVNITKILAIELSKKIEYNGEKHMQTVEFGWASTTLENDSGEALLKAAVNNYLSMKNHHSASVDLTKRITKMIEGDKEVTRRDYNDPEINDISKLIFRYYNFSNKRIFLDNITKLSNRYAFDTEIERLVTNPDQPKYKAIYLNFENLIEYTNSNSSTGATDFLIKTGKALSDLFGTKAYRIGYQVFVCLVLESAKAFSNDDIKRKINSLLVDEKDAVPLIYTLKTLIVPDQVSELEILLSKES